MPNITLTGQFPNLSALDGLFLINNPPSDSAGAGGGEVIPDDPAVWASGPQRNYDWSPFSIAGDGVGQTRFTGRGCTKLSDHWGVVAYHAKGIGAWWLDPAGGVEYQRTWDSDVNIDQDLGLVRWATALPQIPNAVVLADSSQVAARPVVAIEMDRHLNATRTVSALANSNDTVNVQITGPTGTVDFIEGGDSGKPICFPFAGRLVVLAAIFNASSGGAGGQDVANADGPNLAHYITEINAQLAVDGEALTLATLELTDSFTGASFSASRPAAFSPTQYNPALLGT